MVPNEQRRSTLSSGDVAEAVRALSDADWARLHRVAKFYCANRPLNPDDILQEAFCRALDTRVCPAGVSVVKFIAEIVRSVASDAMKSRARHPEAPLDDEASAARPDPGLSAEAALAEKQEMDRIKKAMIGLFSGDPVAEIIVEGTMEEMEGEELRALAGLDKVAFASQRRRIRRTIDKAFPDGWAQ